jgi:hypothetical protein
MNTVKKTPVMNDEILVKYLAGEATEEEQIQVQLWLKQGKENKKYFYDFRLIWNLSRNISPTGSVNEDDAWRRFQERTMLPAIKKPASYLPSGKYDWLKIAAALLLLIGGAWMTYTNFSAINHSQSIVSNPTPVFSNAQPTATITSATNDTGKQNGHTPANINASYPPKIVRDDEKNSATVKANNHKTHNSLHKKEFICNTTPCPIQICINQTMKCPNNKPSAISTYSTLEPDQSGELDYKEKNKVAKNCSLTVKDIEIKSIATGEMIVLNEHSSPSTAQELFSYITRQKKGDILAGRFHADCNNKTGEHGLVFDSNSGNWMLQ